MKHFGTLFPFWLTVQAYALWFFLDIKIMQMLFLGIAEPTGTTRLQTDRVGLAALGQSIDLSPAVSWIPCGNLWEEQERHCLSPLSAPLRGPYSSNITYVCVFVLCLILHYAALYIYNMCIYLPEGKGNFLLNNVNKIRVHIVLWFIWT